MLGQCFCAFSSQEVTILYPDLHRAYKERSCVHDILFIVHLILKYFISIKKYSDD